MANEIRDFFFWMGWALTLLLLNQSFDIHSVSKPCSAMAIISNLFNSENSLNIKYKMRNYIFGFCAFFSLSPHHVLRTKNQFTKIIIISNHGWIKLLDNIFIFIKFCLHFNYLNPRIIVFVSETHYHVMENWYFWPKLYKSEISFKYYFIWWAA